MDRIHYIALAGLLAGGAAVRAEAGEVPLYQPAPAWVVPAQMPAASAATDEASPLLLFDAQQRFENGRTWAYFDAATRIATPQMLAQVATLTFPWAPDKGDLIIHELSVLRGGQRIDLLAQGQKFTVLRREQSLEQLELTGILTATLAAEGLQVGDILRVRASMTMRDEALAGRVQSIAPLLSEPIHTGLARMTFSWPTGAAPHWKILGEGVKTTTLTRGGYTELAISLPTPKQPETPFDAPARFRHPALIEVSSFESWADVSKVMAPLFATEGAIAPGSPLAAEVAAIMKAESVPLARAERALELVQDKIRYLAVDINGGNYIPQKPAKTWEVRYGDCKAKTLLLLSMLHAMGIEAEPVLANLGLGDMVPERLPGAHAFNHVLVRATIGGESFWLDGTGSGASLADIRDTPELRYVLPVRAAGADLLEIPTRPTARPLADVLVEADESSSVDIPSVFDATLVLRGGQAATIASGTAMLAAKERRDMIASYLQQYVGEAQFSQAAMKADKAAGTVTLIGHGVAGAAWQTQDRRQKRSIAQMMDGLEFSPDRGRAAWKAIPVATPGPGGTHYRLRLRLPDGGRGYALEGEADYKGVLAGRRVERTTRLEGGMLVLDERLDPTGAEIPASRVAAEKDAVATARARAPKLVAPPDARRRWELTAPAAAGSQVKAVEATLAAAIAADPEEVSGYTSRASFRAGIGDRRGALADLGRALAIAPSVELYLQRAAVSYDLGDLAAAAADAAAARELDPSSADAVGRIAWLKAEQGDVAGAAALLDERIGLGGDTRPDYQRAKADVLGEFGDPAAAVQLFDALIADKPGSPSLLNGRCWAKGTHNLALDTALKDCTQAIELGSNNLAALDSRAMVWYRMGRDEEALRDLDAVLGEQPDVAGSRFLRAVVLARMGRAADAAKDLAVARRLVPRIDASYARYGIKA